MSEKYILPKNSPPLAERIRPKILSDFLGQNQIINNDSIIYKSIKSQNPFSFILWGPPGTGKTTLARILSKEYGSFFFEISAVSSNIKEIRELLNQGKENFKIGKRSILFIDEIHRFTKLQQALFLSAVEEGSIILIGATTENPTFEVVQPLLSRCQVLLLQPLKSNDLLKILNRALNEDILLSQLNLVVPLESAKLLAKSSGGDARKMLNLLELVLPLQQKGNIEIKINNIEKALQQKIISYDKNGDSHYDVISAFIKSIRGSDPDAAIYWLSIMLEAGEKPEFIARRLIIFASEDVGNAEPYALQLATTAFDAIKRIGMPESCTILSQITIYLAGIPKSNAAHDAISSAMDYINK